ncbi:MAG: hypothetical protein ACKO7W_08700 [Elainella sp.]
MSFDPRTLSKPAYEALRDLRANRSKDDPHVKEQKNQAVELYTYIATWGLLRLKAEELALSQQGKKDVVKAYFTCLADIVGQPELKQATKSGLNFLIQESTSVEQYLGLTGLGLAIAQEFSFWAAAVYHDVKGGE